MSDMTPGEAPQAPGDEAARTAILLVDDSPIERSALARLLRDAGYAVAEASDGAEALERIHTAPPDILLLDLQMPGADGFDVLSALHHSCPHLPVIVLSGLPPRDIQHSIQRLPGRSLPTLLLKPIDTAQLLDLIALHIAGELPA
jgi:CheY-like chemotaxis protein